MHACPGPFRGEGKTSQKACAGNRLFAGEGWPTYAWWACTLGLVGLLPAVGLAWQLLGSNFGPTPGPWLGLLLGLN